MELQLPPIAHSCGNHGFLINGPKHLIDGSYIEFNNGRGITINVDNSSRGYDGSDWAIRQTRVISNDSEAIYVVDSNGGLIDNANVYDNSSTPTQGNSVRVHSQASGILIP